MSPQLIMSQLWLVMVMVVGFRLSHHGCVGLGVGCVGHASVIGHH